MHAGPLYLKNSTWLLIFLKKHTRQSQRERLLAQCVGQLPRPMPRPAGGAGGCTGAGYPGTRVLIFYISNSNTNLVAVPGSPGHQLTSGGVCDRADNGQRDRAPCLHEPHTRRQESSVRDGHQSSHVTGNERGAHAHGVPQAAA